LNGCKWRLALYHSSAIPRIDRGWSPSVLVGVTSLRSPENGSPDFSYFIHAQVVENNTLSIMKNILPYSLTNHPAVICCVSTLIL
jgi:hypothetical protein